MAADVKRQQSLLDKEWDKETLAPSTSQEASQLQSREEESQRQRQANHLARLMEFAQNAVQRRLMRCIFQQRLETPDLTQPNPAERLVGAVKHISSKLVLAERAGLSGTNADRKLKQVASAILEASSMLFSSLFKRVQNMIDSGFEACLIGRSRKYDESPFRLRVSESGEVHSRWSASSAAPSIATLESTFHRVFVLLRCPKKDGCGGYNYQYVHGQCPQRMHVIKSTAAVNIKKTQDLCLATRKSGR